MSTGIIAVINKIIAAVGKVITLIFAFLPDSPFIFDLSQTVAESWFKYINYLIPVEGIVTHLSLFVFAVAVYYVIRIALRWVKAIS